MARFEPGRLVTSTAGRDRNERFLVYRIDPDGHVWVVDGAKRPVERPKRKNPKHLKAHDQVAPDLAERWSRGEPVDNGEVQEALRALEEALGVGEGGRLVDEP